MKILREYLKLRKLIKIQYRNFWLGLLISVFSTFFNGASIGTIVPLVDRVFAHKPIVLPEKIPHISALKNLVMKMNSMEPMLLLKLAIVFLILMVIGKGATFYLQNYLLRSFGARILTNIRLRIYEKIQWLSMEFFSRKKTGELTSRIVVDVSMLDHVLSRELPVMVLSVCQAIVFFVIVLLIDWKLTLMALVIFPVMLLPILNLGKKLRKISRILQINWANLGNIIHESIYGQSIIKAYNQEQKMIERFSKENEAIFRSSLSVIKRTSLVSPFSELLTTLGGSLVIMFGVSKVLNNEFSSGFLFMFIAGLVSLISPLKTITNAITYVYMASAVLPRIYTVLEEKQTVVDAGKKECPQLKSKIFFDNVSFKYEDSVILKNITFEIKAGEKIGVVGPIGAGKSSLINLLIRLYEPFQGRILFDGIDIKEFTLRSLRSRIGVVTQEPILFSDTIRNNICFGSENVSEKDFQRAVEIARVAEFVGKLKDGYETIVGERGHTLSGGQKQLICLARAILKNPQILLFDEITASLDSQSEKILHHAIEDVMRNRTVIFVAHRLATVRNLDRIVVIKDGHIEEIGTHSQLIDKNGFYASLWTYQHQK
ncbi:MAG: ABC transporter ATP-binding protein/permease [Candidatus Omnitrophica bacterium]|nr:ABC transporter ATP-binding protein/permease [Candidatus Omnitrophota bacterium]MCM8788222.1 ABC transporter ATP-binding protein/permease [Candidatus Omnitrophota bacterium]